MWKWFIAMFTDRHQDERGRRVDADTERTDASTKRTDAALAALEMRVKLMERDHD